MSSGARVAFHVRNAFQVSHFRPLFEAIDGAVWIGRSRAKLRSFGVGESEPQRWSAYFLRQLMDRNFDIVVSQAAPPHGKRLKRAKFVMVQYGYAKEPYNFGEWRSMADLILAYGDYAQSRFAARALSVAIGNPRWDDWRSEEFRTKAIGRIGQKLESQKKTVLYAPTWGDLSSAPDWLEAVCDLSEEFNVLIKAHHNSTRDGQIDAHKVERRVHFLPDEDLFALLTVADAMISDLSGAIFDAVLCQVPVVLVLPSNLEARFGSKLDRDSIELSQRAEFGIEVDDTGKLRNAVASAIEGGPRTSRGWYHQLFRTDGVVAEHFVTALKTLSRS